MKAKENITPKRKEVRAPAAPQRLTARLVTQTFNRIATEMESLANSTHAKTQRQAAISGLFSIINVARAALLQVTGATGIISQNELCRMNRSGCVPYHNGTPHEFFHQEFKEQLGKGSIIEPGPWHLYRNREGNLYLAVYAGKGRTWKCHDSGAAVYARKREAQALTVPELEALYALPSDGSPA